MDKMCRFLGRCFGARRSLPAASPALSVDASFGELGIFVSVFLVALASIDGSLSVQTLHTAYLP